LEFYYRWTTFQKTLPFNYVRKPVKIIVANGIPFTGYGAGVATGLPKVIPASCVSAVVQTTGAAHKSTGTITT